jgi:hypothetical protein
VYSLLEITKPEDKLVAISGVAQQIEKEENSSCCLPSEICSFIASRATLLVNNRLFCGVFGTPRL